MSQRNESNLRRIPLSADAPVPILFWEPVDFIGAISIFGMGVALKMFLFGAVGCVVMLTLASKLRQGAKRGAAQHWLWYMGLVVDRGLQRMRLTSANNDFIR